VTRKKMTKSEDSSSRKNVFDSLGFNNFLHQKLMRSNDSVNGILGSSDLSVFKSKESFVSSFLSKDWETNPSSTKGLHVGGDEKPWKATETLNTTKSIGSDTNNLITKHGKRAIQKSQDWLTFNTLGDHVEIPYSMGMFNSTVSSKKQSEASLSISSSSSIRTDFNTSSNIYIQEQPAAASSKSNMASTVKDMKKKKKRKRAPRKKIIPQNKKYITPSEKDVLMGRGGKSNHHPGNMQYRTEIDRLQDRYKDTDDKDEKTSISANLVLHVQSYGGNFCEKDEDGWYIIEDVVARRKVSQALREDKDPEKRRAKRQRFLSKKARLKED